MTTTTNALCHPPVGARVLLQPAADSGEEPLELQVDKALKKGADGACVLLAPCAPNDGSSTYVGKCYHHGDRALANEAETLAVVYKAAMRAREEPLVPKFMGVAKYEAEGGRTMGLLVMEKFQCDVKDLIREYQAKMGRPLPIKAALQLCEHVIAALQQFHRAGRAHLDMNQGNIMFSERPPFRIKLIDATRALPLQVQRWQTEPGFVGRRVTMRGAQAFASAHTFRGLQWCGREDLCAGVRCCLAAVTMAAQDDQALRAAWKAVDATKEKYGRGPSAKWNHPDMAAACEAYLKARGETDKRWIGDICALLPESTASEFKLWLTALLDFVDECPFVAPIPKMYQNATDPIQEMIALIDQGPDTYHKDDLETAFEEAGFVVPKPTPPPSPSPQHEESREEEEIHEEEAAMEVEWEGEVQSYLSSSGASASTEEEETTRKRRRGNVKAYRYDKALNEPREEGGDDSDESEGEDDLAWADGVVERGSRKTVGRKRRNITV
ncbi:unnamed protein product [Vitrella brassicaformis CCMP3155]|uniref:Protein kinase domain-containing protein n=1 Tax=Vitrella brassicaformis (strain CCMP3155) TaxID=1169540 RepID=A0A0G4EEF6_VITBC|nr:unnamed protein product [Vitrella brassicaformis CCMP3155]|eukprot:CEL93748.1 unnamed protein product [Vitrella brassicaformis CCMP3155]